MAIRVMLGGGTDGKSGGTDVSRTSPTTSGVPAVLTQGLRRGRQERGLGSDRLKPVSAMESREALSRSQKLFGPWLLIRESEA